MSALCGLLQCVAYPQLQPSSDGVHASPLRPRLNLLSKTQDVILFVLEFYIVLIMRHCKYAYFMKMGMEASD